jgi:catechol 2,3-dioxygenase-like lactoylglutathione lyase family enzyme
MEIDHLVLAVTNLAASVAHYDRLFPILGFRKERDHVWTNAQHIFIELRQARDSSRAYARQQQRQVFDEHAELVEDWLGRR